MNLPRRYLLGAAVASALLAREVVSRTRTRNFYRGKVAFITGGSRGLGLAIARELVQRGAAVAICGRDEATLANAVRDLRARGAQALAIPCDIRSDGELTIAIRRAEQELGEIDVAIHNAGTIAVGPLDSMTREDYEDALATHFWPAITLVSRVAPQMRERRSGRIVLVSSIGGKISVPHLLPYSVSKFALTAFGEGLRSELAPHNVGVTTVCPGLMRTGSPRNAYFKGKHRAEYTWFALSDTLPLMSMPAKQAAREIVDACARNQAEAILGVPAKLAVAAQGIAPNMSIAALSLAARVLPSFGGIGTERTTGAQSETAITQSALTALNRRAERDLNQL